MTSNTAHAKAAWIAMLAEQRRPWPEWTELERRVREREFVVHSIGPHRFLFSDARTTDAAEPPLSRRIAPHGPPVPAIDRPFPAWIAALIGLACTSAGDLSSAGELAGDLWPPDRLRPITTREEWAAAWHFEPLATPLARPIYLLQRNRSGTPLFSDGARVLAFAEATRTLEDIADLEAFLRFCVRQCARGEDWVVAWRRGDGEPEGIRRPNAAEHSM